MSRNKPVAKKMRLAGPKNRQGAYPVGMDQYETWRGASTRSAGRVGEKNCSCNGEKYGHWRRENLFVPLRKGQGGPRGTRAPRAMREVRSFLVRHTKTNTVVIDQALNEHVWGRGIQKPPSRVRVRVVKEEVDTDAGKVARVNVYLAE